MTEMIAGRGGQDIRLINNINWNQRNVIPIDYEVDQYQLFKSGVRKDVYREFLVLFPC